MQVCVPKTCALNKKCERCQGWQKEARRKADKEEGCRSSGSKKGGEGVGVLKLHRQQLPDLKEY